MPSTNLPNNIPDYITIIISIISLTAAALAWVAKIVWSKEYGKAKDETIKAKEATISLLEREIKSIEKLSSVKLEEYFENSIKNLENNIEYIKELIEKSENKILHLEDEVYIHKTKSSQQSKNINDLTEDKIKLENDLIELRSALAKANDRYEATQLALTSVKRLGPEPDELLIGRFDEAQQAYWKAIELDPDNSDSWKEIGMLLVKRGKLDEAESAYRESIKLDPVNSDSWKEIGNLLMEIGRFDEAEAAFREAIRNNPSDSESWKGLGKLLIKS